MDSGVDCLSCMGKDRCIKNLLSRNKYHRDWDKLTDKEGKWVLDNIPKIEKYITEVAEK